MKNASSRSPKYEVGCKFLGLLRPALAFQVRFITLSIRALVSTHPANPNLLHISMAYPKLTRLPTEPSVGQRSALVPTSMMFLKVFVAMFSGFLSSIFV